jgi:transposase
MPTVVKRRYFELIRAGLSGSAAADEVGVSLSCGSLWFIDAGQVSFIEIPISPRYLSQDDRIEIADGIARGEPVKQIAARIGKSHQSVYREIMRTASPTAVTNPGMRTTRPTFGAGDPSRAGSPSMPSCVPSWPASWLGTGHRPRSAGGCGAVTGGVRAGTCALRPSTRRSTAA